MIMDIFCGVVLVVLVVLVVFAVISLMLVMNIEYIIGATWRYIKRIDWGK